MPCWAEEEPLAAVIASLPTSCDDPEVCSDSWDDECFATMLAVMLHVDRSGLDMVPQGDEPD